MPRATGSNRRIWPSPWAAAMRNRLQFFRLLTLILAQLPLYGVGLAFIDTSRPDRAALIAAASIPLTLLWVWGYRRDGLPLRWLPVELALFLMLMAGVRDDYGAFGVMFFALQHRALFGRRRDTTTVAFAYAATLIAGYAFIPQGLQAYEPIVFVELAVGGFAAYMMHTLQEVLQRDRQRKRELRESEQRFRSVIENLREALLITDLDDRIILANQRVHDVLGHEPGELIGQVASDLLLPEARRGEFRDRMLQRLAGHAELYEAEILRKDGTLIFAEVSAAPYRDATGVIVGTLGAISDISQRKRLEERLHEAMRLQVVGHLAGGVAHDFNNLLTVIKVHTELLLADLDRTDPNRDSIAEIARSADRGAALTQKLLAFGRKQLLQPRRLVLSALVQSCAGRLRDLVADNVQVTTSDDSGQTPVFADPSQIERVLEALTRNANDALPDGGRITVHTRLLVVDAERPPADNQDMPTGAYVELSVTDTGVGVPEAVREHLFEPFVTTKAPGAGSGLGLASVYGVVRQSGGFVTVESTPGRGTTFRLFFPALDAGSHSERAAPELQTA